MQPTQPPYAFGSGGWWLLTFSISPSTWDMPAVTP